MPNRRRRLILRFFHLLYGPLSGLHDPIAWMVSRGRWWRWGQCALEWVPEDGPLLEIGPGTGRLLEHKIADDSRRGKSRFVVGVDRSPAMLRRARRRLNRLYRTGARTGPASLVMADARRLPFAAGSFSSAIATFPSPAVLSPAAISDVRRVLAPGGTAAFVLAATPVGQGLWDVLARIALGAGGSTGGADRAGGQRDDVEAQPGISITDRASGHRKEADVRRHPGITIAERARAAGLEATTVVRNVDGDQVWLVVAMRPNAPRS